MLQSDPDIHLAGHPQQAWTTGYEAVRNQAEAFLITHSGESDEFYSHTRPTSDTKCVYKSVSKSLEMLERLQ